MRNTQVIRDTLGWGIALWVVGYVLGIVLFAVFPVGLIGWMIMPVGSVVTLWVLVTRVKADSVRSYAVLSIVWTLIAVAFDYAFIVKAFSPTDGYYKLDVYLYYALTFLLPLAVGWWKSSRTTAASRAT